MAMAMDTAQSLTTNSVPTLPDFSFQHHSRSDSTQSSRNGSFFQWPPTSPSKPCVRSKSSGHTRNESKEHPETDKASAMDTRRFTPNLHASLVSEILSLRREIETKNTALTGLEESLQSSKLENGQLSATLTNRERDIRSAKKDLQILESGTLEALGDLAKERDEAVESLADVRKRLEASRGDMRAHEEGARRTQALWEQDKQNWDNERRNIERKVHVAEGRLRTMVNEVAAAQAHNHLPSISGSELEEGIGETWFSNWSDIISTRSSSVRGRYHLSELSNNTYDTNELANLRNSTVAGYGNLAGIEPSSLTLAEELNLEEAVDDYNRGHAFSEDVISPDALPEENPFKPRRDSIQSQDNKARRVLGLRPDSIDQASPKESSAEKNAHSVLEKSLPPLQVEEESMGEHRDAGTQSTPRPLLKTSVQELEASSDKDPSRNALPENAANQRRKRTSIPSLSPDASASKPEAAVVSATASAACQTVTQPTSPLLVPMIALEPMFPDPASISSPMMVSSSTQTEDENESAARSAGARDLSPGSTIPVIAIHPPGSRPGSSYNNVVLPPRTKNAFCQTMTPSPWSSRSIAVQTDGMRADKRPLKIPPRLMPAAATSKPPSHRGSSPRKALPKTATRAGLRSPPPVDPPRTSTRQANSQVKDGHTAKLQNRPKSKQQPWRSASPTKSDNLFAGFSDSEGAEKVIDFSEDDDFADVAPIRKTLSKVQSSWKLIPASTNAGLGSRPRGRPISDIQEIDDTCDAAAEASTRDVQAVADTKQKAPMADALEMDNKGVVSMNALPPINIRKAALISNGALAHMRQRSGSEPGPGSEASSFPPPFPVPTRSSSRKIPFSSSEGNGSPTPYTTSFISGMRGRPQAPAKNPLRKVRSAAAVPKYARNNSRQDEIESLAITSPVSTPLGSPRLPWISYSESASQLSNAPPQSLEAEVASSVSHPDQAAGLAAETSSVVDAIAQTMVGEWMWKYIRKRKSFGIGESPQAEFEEARQGSENHSGVRHKRWVWLAPYERTIMWSGKQPTNGSALLGKGERKLSIQSVLDVQDDTPMPKGADSRQVFGRSILILTPQRALKFTAASRDRHYMWLTALSFLSHSTLGMDNLAAMPPLPQSECQFSHSQADGSLRRSPRDSLKIYKSKERSTMHPRHGTASMVNVAVNRVSGQDSANDSLTEAAEAPQIPRMTVHTRTRSNTGPRPGLHSAFNSFPTAKTSSQSQMSKSASQQDVSMSVSKGFQGMGGRPSAMTRHMSEAEAVGSDFLDKTVGTVRMEAFVERMDVRSAAGGGGKAQPGSRSGSYRTAQGRKKDMRYWGLMNHASSPDVAQQGGRSSWKTDDPFQGF
ncbi:MAG: hypothetical protein Q9212_005943 [Teloschistes hypoglaucus]